MRTPSPGMVWRKRLDVQRPGCRYHAFTLQEMLLAAAIGFVLLGVLGKVFTDTLNFCRYVTTQTSMCQDVALFRKQWRRFAHSQASPSVRMQDGSLYIGSAQATVRTGNLVLKTERGSQEIALPQGMSAAVSLEPVAGHAQLLVLTLSWSDRLSRARPLQQVRVVACAEPLPHEATARRALP